MHLKDLARSALRLAWRKLLRPLLERLPADWGARLITLAHYAKMTLVHGDTLDLSTKHTSPSLQSASPPPSASAARTPVPAADGSALSPKSFVSSLLSNNKSPPIVPDWVCAELAELALIEPELTPTSAFIKRFHVYRPPMMRDAAEVYAQCRRLVDDLQPDMVLLVPWLVKGGADLGALHHAEAATRAGCKVLLVATENAESPWASRVPDGAGFLEFGKLSHKLSAEQRMTVFARVMLDTPARVVHVINSQLGWELVKRHGRSLTALEKRIFVSVFSDGRDENGIMWSYPRFYFADCWKYLSGVMCDSRWYPNDLMRQYGIPERKLHTAYFPLVAEQAPRYRSRDDGAVLWASRITESKRPDLLIEIARKMPDVQFEIFGYATKAERHYEDALRTIPNLRLRGAYDSLEEIVAGGAYCAFLYTSSWDGLPNVLLEATAAGLPVVASAICGVPEFITPETGYPVFAPDDADEYVRSLREVLDAPDVRAARWDAARALLQSQHSMDVFLARLWAIPGYLSQSPCASQSDPRVEQ